MARNHYRAAGSTGEVLRNGVTAHRGDSVAFPQNTMAAFRSALNLGADWIELDVQRTADGKLVVMQDKRTNSVADVDLEVSSCVYDELALVDVAHRHRKKHALSLGECPKARAPLLTL